MKLLEGVRVLVMTNVLAGPFATSLLALSGAEVVKIENPDGGDLARKLGNVPELNAELMGTSFLAQNANKKSLTLNLKQEEAREIFVRLVEKADVLVQNCRRGVMERLGLSYAVPRKKNPRLVYCAISGFGQTGDAESRLRQALALDPSSADTLLNLGRLLAANGRRAEARPLLEGFQRLAPAEIYGREVRAVRAWLTSTRGA